MRDFQATEQDFKICWGSFWGGIFVPFFIGGSAGVTPTHRYYIYIYMYVGDLLPFVSVFGTPDRPSIKTLEATGCQHEDVIQGLVWQTFLNFMFMALFLSLAS